MAIYSRSLIFKSIPNGRGCLPGYQSSPRCRSAERLLLTKMVRFPHSRRPGRGEAVLLAGNNGDDVPRLAAVVERQRRELALARAEADVAAVVAMARGVLMERHGWSVTEAARELTDMA